MSSRALAFPVTRSRSSIDISEAERKRHIRHYETTSSPLLQETRGLNELTGETFSLRTKEDAEDYRYMPDANLPAMIIKPVRWVYLSVALSLFMSPIPSDITYSAKPPLDHAECS